MKFKGLPEREADEGPATERQIRYLLSLVPWLKESDVRKLGIKQASYFIDQALKESEENGDSDDDDEDYTPKKRKSKKSESSGCSAVILIFLGLASWVVFKLFGT